MRYSQTGDQLAEGAAFVAARAFWLAHVNRENGAHRGREREIESLKILLGAIGQAYPNSIDEAYRLAQEHHEYTLRNREWRRP